LISKEAYNTVPNVLFVRKDFYLLDAINEKINIFKLAGLIDHWNSQNLDKKAMYAKEEKEPKVLSLSSLIVCFQILIFGSFLAFISFLIEIFMQNFKNKL
jgi:hypothetical protein